MNELAKRLQDYDAKGVTFYDAKQELLTDGYTENEISIAVASHPFGEKPKAPNQNAEIFAKNP